jgi:hypothetical protein
MFFMKKLIFLVVFISLNLVATAQKLNVGEVNGNSATMTVTVAQLNEALIAAKKLDSPIIQEGAKIVSGKDKKNETFWYVEGTALENDKTAPIAVSLTLEGKIVVFSSANCVVRCLPEGNCSGCSLSILVPCLDFNCNCLRGDGGCGIEARF